MEFKIIININIILCLKYNDESHTYNTILLYISTHNSESSSDIMLQYTLAKGSLVVLPPGLLHAGSLGPVLPGEGVAAPLLGHVPGPQLRLALPRGVPADGPALRLPQPSVLRTTRGLAPVLPRNLNIHCISTK